MKKLLIFKSLYAFVLLLLLGSTCLHGENDTSEAAQEQKGPKLTLEEKRSLYEKESKAFREAQREWVLAHLDEDSTAEEAALLKAQFIRDNFEWRMLVGQLKFDFEHGFGKAHKTENKPVKAAMKEMVKATVTQMRAEAEALGDWRGWREAAVYEEASAEIIELEGNAEVAEFVEEAAE